MSATATQDERGDKRERILDAALELFAEKGFHGTPVPEIAAKAKVGAGTIYRYFPSKEALVNALYQTWKRAMLESVAGDLDMKLPPRQQWRRLVRRIAAFAQEHPRAFLFLEGHHHAAYLDAHSRGIEAQVMGMAEMFLDQTRQAGLTRDVPPQLLIAVLWGGTVRLIKGSYEGLLELDEPTLERFEALTWEVLRA